MLLAPLDVAVVLAVTGSMLRSTSRLSSAIENLFGSCTLTLTAVKSQRNDPPNKGHLSIRNTWFCPVGIYYFKVLTEAHVQLILQFSNSE